MVVHVAAAERSHQHALAQQGNARWIDLKIRYRDVPEVVAAKQRRMGTVSFLESEFDFLALRIECKHIPALICDTRER